MAANTITEEYAEMYNLSESNCNLNVGLIDQAIDEKGDLNRLIRECYTPLYLAAFAGDMFLVKLLLDYGADVNWPSKGGETPLYVACEVGRPDIVEALLEGGARFRFKDEKRFPSTPINVINVACRHGHYEVIKVLLDKGGVLDVVLAGVNPDGETPLHIACLTGNVDIVKLLLESFELFYKLEFVTTDNGPVFFRPNGDYEESLKQIRDFKWSELNWIANHSIQYPNRSSAEYYKVWEAGYKANEHDPFSFDRISAVIKETPITPLVLAIQIGHTQIVSLLLDKRASTGVLYNGHNLLMLACEYKHYEVFHVLFQTYMKTDQRIEESLVKEIFKAFNEHLYDIVGVYFVGCERKPILIEFNSASYFTFLKQHMKALKVVGLCNLYDDILSVDQQTLDRCNIEIKNMKDFNVLNDMSLYVVFERYNNPYYLRNQNLLENLEKYLNSPLALDQFPLYCNILKNRLQMSKHRLTLLFKVSKALEGQEWWDKLPLLQQECILLHLDNTDLEKMAISV